MFYIEAGQGIMRSNVYFVRSGASWVLIDTASAGCGPLIQAAAEALFGANTRPAAIMLTHIHPDHCGSALELARRWNCLVYVHPDELRFATADPSNFFATYRDYKTSVGQWTPPPLDRWLILPLMRIMPKRARDRVLAASSLQEVARAFDPMAGLPGLADWECLPTPGHTPGHVAFFRPADRILITGDAVVTIPVNSIGGFLLWVLGHCPQRLSLPPWYTTWGWHAAKESVARIAGVAPCVLASGHGIPLTNPATANKVRAFAAHL